MSELAGIVFLAVAAIVILLAVSPETWLLVSVITDRGRRGVRVRLRDGPVAQTARARRDFSVRRGISRGQVFIDGEVWAAESADPDARIRAGDMVRVTDRQGLTLRVEPPEAGDSAS